MTAPLAYRVDHFNRGRWIRGIGGCTRLAAERAAIQVAIARGDAVRIVGPNGKVARLISAADARRLK